MFNSPISPPHRHRSPSSPFTHPFSQNLQTSAFTSSPSMPNLDNFDELPPLTKLTKNSSSSNDNGLSTRESSIGVAKQRSRKESFESEAFFSPYFSKEFESPSSFYDDEEIQLKRLPQLKASDFEIIIDVIPRNLIMSPETSLVYPCYVSLRLKQDLFVENPGVDILLILDIKDHEISSVINVMQNVLPRLSEHDRLALFTTQGTCAKRLPFKVMDEPFKSTFINECRALKELRNTKNSLKNVLQSSLEVIKNRKYENHLAAIFLITDSDEEIALDQIIKKDIFTPQQPIIYAFGLGQKHNPVNLAQVCEHFEGAYSYTENFYALEKAMKTRISQLGEIQAKNIKIKIQTNPFQLTKIYDKNIINEESTQFYETQRNYLSLKKGIDLALEIQVPKYTKPISEIQHCASSIKLDFTCENLVQGVSEISLQYTREFDIKMVPSFEYEICKKQVDLKSLEKFCEVKMLVRYFQVLMMVNYGLVGSGIQVLNGLKTDLSAFTKFGGNQIRHIMKIIEWTIDGLDSSRLKTKDMLMLIQNLIY